MFAEPGRKNRLKLSQRSWRLLSLLSLGLFFWATPCRAQFNSLPKAEDAIKLGTPTPDQLFQIQSEKSLRQSIREEARRQPNALPVIFPQDTAPASQAYPGRAWPHQVRYTVPGYVCYGRLFFEQLNFERYGWDLGPVTPFLSAGKFYYDLAALPIHVALDPCRWCDCNTGYCLPGDPVPLLLYPPACQVAGHNR